MVPKFTIEQVQEAYEKLQPDMQAILNSEDVQKSVVSIGNKNNLQIDQVGALTDLVGLIMLRLIKPEDFIKNLQESAEIDYETATQIVKDINQDVFFAMKNLTAKNEDLPQVSQEIPRPDIKDHSAIEQHGNFSVDNSYKHPDSHPETEVHTVEDREVLINSIENPSAIRSVPTGTFTSSTNRYSEPLVDQLLNSPTAIPAERITRRENFSPADVPNNDVPVPKNLPSDDLYREPIS